MFRRTPYQLYDSKSIEQRREVLVKRTCHCFEYKTFHSPGSNVVPVLCKRTCH
uniref:Uncharacterized protein n=1 Tax=Rhizophora mucronata TaxID=61149 RepID=A0A2P2QMJ6_RHIMU